MVAWLELAFHTMAQVWDYKQPVDAGEVLITVFVRRRN